MREGVEERHRHTVTQVVCGGDGRSDLGGMRRRWLRTGGRELARGEEMEGCRM